METLRLWDIGGGEKSIVFFADGGRGQGRDREVRCRYPVSRDPFLVPCGSRLKEMRKVRDFGNATRSEKDHSTAILPYRNTAGSLKIQFGTLEGIAHLLYQGYKAPISHT
jgi:hypothetical protein